MKPRMRAAEVSLIQTYAVEFDRMLSLMDIDATVGQINSPTSTAPTVQPIAAPVIGSMRVPPHVETIMAAATPKRA